MQPLRHSLNGWIFCSLFILAQAGTALFGEELPDPAQLIKKLNIDNFDERNATIAALEKLGEDARKALEAARTANPQPEARRSIERLLGKLPPKRVIYAKLLLPGDAKKDTDYHKVESWIAEDLKLGDESKVHAISGWFLISEDLTTKFMNELRCGIPANGRMKRESGKIKVVFTIHGPFPTEVHGNVLNDEMGIRTVSTIGSKLSPHAYVALMVGPEPGDAAAYHKTTDAKEDSGESFKP